MVKAILLYFYVWGRLMSNDPVIEICNLAASALKLGRVTSLDNRTELERYLKQYFHHSRDKTFQSHTWKECTFRQTLAPTGEAPEFGYAYKFRLPADPWCIRPVGLYDVPRDTPWTQEGRYLLCDLNPVQLVFIGRETNPDVYSPLLKEAIALRLAADIAFPLTGDMSKKQAMEAMFEKVRDEARSIDTTASSSDGTYIDDRWTSY